jgi:hypothetical protein
VFVQATKKGLTIKDRQSIPGIVSSTIGVYNITAWQNLTLDNVMTFVDYFAVVIGPGTFSYSISHGLQVMNYSAICQYGKLKFRRYDVRY